MVNLTNLLLIAKEHIRFTYDLMQGANGRKKKVLSQRSTFN